MSPENKSRIDSDVSAELARVIRRLVLESPNPSQTLNDIMSEMAQLYAFKMENIQQNDSSSQEFMLFEAIKIIIYDLSSEIMGEN
jgi:hypothetical protein